MPITMTYKKVTFWLSHRQEAMSKNETGNNPRWEQREVDMSHDNGCLRIDRCFKLSPHRRGFRLYASSRHRRAAESIRTPPKSADDSSSDACVQEWHSVVAVVRASCEEKATRI